MRNPRSLVGNVAVGCFAGALLLVAVAFASTAWLTSAKGARQTTMGLWTHCSTWLADPGALYDRRFLVGCQPDIAGFSVPAYNRRVMTATQTLFTICLACASIGFIFSLAYVFFCAPEHRRFVWLLRAQAWCALVGAVCGAVAIVTFASQRDLYVWMPYHSGVRFGWSLYVAVVGVLVMLAAGACFLRDLRMHDSAPISARRRTPTPTKETIVDLAK